jgi:hypothetical protein
LDLIADLPVVDVTTQAVKPIRDLGQVYSDGWLQAIT